MALDIADMMTEAQQCIRKARDAERGSPLRAKHLSEAESWCNLAVTAARAEQRQWPVETRGLVNAAAAEGL